MIPDRCLKHHWGKPDGKQLGKQLEKQVDVVELLKTRCCTDFMQELINNFGAILATNKIIHTTLHAHNTTLHYTHTLHNIHATLHYTIHISYKIVLLSLNIL